MNREQIKEKMVSAIDVYKRQVGASTVKMGELKAGDSFRDFTGPLGCASEFVHEDLESCLLYTSRCV